MQIWHVINKFFKDNPVGILLFAIIAGVLTNLASDVLHKEQIYLSIDMRKFQSNIFDADFIFTNHGDSILKDVKVLAKVNASGINLKTGSQLKLVGVELKELPLMNVGDILGRDNKTARMRDPWQVLTETVPLLSELKAAIQWEKAITCLIVSFETESGEKKQLDFGGLIDKKNNIDHWITRPCEDYRDPNNIFK